MEEPRQLSRQDVGATIRNESGLRPGIPYASISCGSSNSDCTAG